MKLRPKGLRRRTPYRAAPKSCDRESGGYASSHSCRDTASPVESADYLPIAFLLAGKENLTYRAWPADHRFQETLPDGKRADRRPEVVRALFEWLG